MRAAVDRWEGPGVPASVNCTIARSCGGMSAEARAGRSGCICPSVAGCQEYTLAESFLATRPPAHPQPAEWFGNLGACRAENAHQALARDRPSPRRYERGEPPVLGPARTLSVGSYRTQSFS